MSFTSQMIFNITIIFITVTLVVGVILSGIALFRIAGALKLRNRMLRQATRPYLICQRNHQQLMIKNLGPVSVTIDEIESDFDLTSLNQQLIYANQSLYYNLTKPDKLTLSVKYHDEIDNYQADFNL
ncbi:hypothetical protein ACFQAV_10045 [Companilactobacillus huachuanensis]|uniref:Uncharacterized protein n=1 Tax=Companilactobacillus huachuanensis TaxID=2559914 RepID=A0ABW1RPR6_9LACO|nr:hypothetical protein [Companilactobacillus huachuanensis]